MARNSQAVWGCCLGLVFLMALAVDAHGSIADIIERGRQDFEQRRAGILAKRTMSASVTGGAQKPKHICEHEHTREPGVLPPRESLPAANKRAATPWTPIRFKADYSRVDSDPNQCLTVSQEINLGQAGTYTCTADDLIDADFRVLIKENIFPTAFKVMQSLLKVQSQGTRSYLSSWIYNNWENWRQCAESGPNITIPADLIEGADGFEGDFWVAVSTRPVPSNTNIATCWTCSFEVRASDDNYVELGRPTAAVVNTVPSFFKGLVTGSYDYDNYMRVLLHELTHGLGLTSFIRSYLDDHFPYLKSYYLPYQSLGIELVTLFTGPAVTAFARAHFNCPTLEGYPVENLGSSGTVGSHWKQTYAADEYMAGINIFEPKISNLTLAFFQDLQFYQVNFTQSEPLLWGAGKGCSFILDGCASGSGWDDNGYKCAGTAEGCTFDRSAGGACDTEPTMNCRFVEPYSNMHCTNPDETLFRPHIYYGLDSSCYDVKISNWSSNHLCMKFNCSDDDTLSIYAVDVWRQCGDGNNITSADGTYFTITCPRTSENFCARRKARINLPEPLLAYPPYDSSVPGNVAPKAPGTNPPVKGGTAPGTTVPTGNSATSFAASLWTLFALLVLAVNL